MNRQALRIQKKRGFSLAEVLISFAILVSTGVMLTGFLHKGPITQKARNENYGLELGKIYLLTEDVPHDTVFAHDDEKGNHWEILLKHTVDGDEICNRATPVRNKVDTTRSLYYCRYKVGHAK